MSSKKAIVAVFILLLTVFGGQSIAPTLSRIARPSDAETIPGTEEQEGLGRFFQNPLGVFSWFDQKRPSPDEGLGVTRAKNQLAIPEKSPEDLPANVQEIRKKLYAEPIDDHNGDLLLAENDAWIIEYIPTPQLFLVTIRKDPSDTAKKEAERWFLNAGLTQEDLCDLPVRFLLGSEELRRTNIAFTSLPNGCE